MEKQEEAIEASNRKHTRIAVKLQATIRLDSGVTIDGHIHNVSFGGAYISCTNMDRDMISPGEQCALTLYLGIPNEAPSIGILARIVRTDTEGVGLSFISTDLDGYWHFKQLMVYNSHAAEVLLEELENSPGLIVGSEPDAMAH